jgi:hypothetical protein
MNNILKKELEKFYQEKICYWVDNRFIYKIANKFVEFDRYITSKIFVIKNEGAKRLYSEIKIKKNSKGKYYYNFKKEGYYEIYLIKKINNELMVKPYGIYIIQQKSGWFCEYNINSLQNKIVINEDDLKEYVPNALERMNNVNISFKFNDSDVFMVEKLNDFPKLKQVLKDTLEDLVDINWHPVYSIHLINMWCLFLNNNIDQNKYSKQQQIKALIYGINKWVRDIQNQIMIEEQLEERDLSLKYDDLDFDTNEQLSKEGLRQFYS